MIKTFQLPKTKISFAVNDFNILLLEKDERQVTHKIAYHYIDAVERVKCALASGKTILLLPGTYDLLHAGHLTWFDQSLRALQKKKGLSRKDIYVVVPYDSDKLVSCYKGYKHVSNGGTELFARPIVNEKMRGIALAAVDYTDLVTPIPSPFEVDSVFKNSSHLDVSRMSKHLEKNKSKLLPEDYDALERTLKVYERLSQNPEITKIRAEFTFSSLNKIDKTQQQIPEIEEGVWSYEAWQLIYYLSKMAHDVLANSSKDGPRVYRALSKHDAKLLKRIKMVMDFSGIATLVIKEDFIISTSTIVSKIKESKDLESLLQTVYPRHQ